MPYKEERNNTPIRGKNIEILVFSSGDTSWQNFGQFNSCTFNPRLTTTEYKYFTAKKPNKIIQFGEVAITLERGQVNPEIIREYNNTFTGGEDCSWVQPRYTLHATLCYDGDDPALSGWWVCRITGVVFDDLNVRWQSGEDSMETLTATGESYKMEQGTEASTG